MFGKELPVSNEIAALFDMRLDLAGFNCVSSFREVLGRGCRGWAEVDLQLIFQPDMEYRWEKYILCAILAIWLPESNRKNEMVGGVLAVGSPG